MAPLPFEQRLNKYYSSEGLIMRVSGLFFSSFLQIINISSSSWNPPLPPSLKAPCYTTTNLHTFQPRKPQNPYLIDFPTKSSYTLMSKHPSCLLFLFLSLTHSHTLSHSYTFVFVSRATPKNGYMIFCKCVYQAQKKKRKGVVVFLLLRLQDCSFCRFECRCC